MALIKKLKNGNNTIYPLTSARAVFDENGHTLAGGGVLDYIIGPKDTGIDLSNYTFNQAQSVMTFLVLGNEIIRDNWGITTDGQYPSEVGTSCTGTGALILWLDNKLFQLQNTQGRSQGTLAFLDFGTGYLIKYKRKVYITNYQLQDGFNAYNYDWVTVKQLINPFAL